MTLEGEKMSEERPLHVELFRKMVERRLFKPFGNTPTVPDAIATTKVLVLTYRYHANPQTFVEVLQDFYNGSKKKGRGRL